MLVVEFVQVLVGVFEKVQEVVFGFQCGVVVVIYFGVDVVWFVEFVEDCQGIVVQVFFDEIMWCDVLFDVGFYQMQYVVEVFYEEYFVVDWLQQV